MIANRFPRFLLCITCVVIVVVLFVRFRLGVVRYFDPDEFAYLNWAYHVSAGYQPYKDFMMLVTPLYVMLTAPIFWFFGGVTPAIAGRIVSFTVFLILAGTVSAVFWELKRSWFFSVAGLVLLILPMPSDKFLEFRPDTLALTFFFSGFLFQMRYERRGKSIESFFSGLFYAFSLLTLQKLAPFVVLAGGYYVLCRPLTFLHKRTASVYSFFIGFCVPIAVFTLWAFVIKSPQLVWYSVIQLPFESSAIERFNRVPLLFYFQPNAVYYGTQGFGIGILANYLLWITSLSMCCMRLFLGLLKKKKRIQADTLIALLFLYSIISYLWIIPLKHPQYLMMSAPFVAWYIADALNSMWKHVAKTRMSYMFAGAAYSAVILSLSIVFYFTNALKFSWTNESALGKMKELYSVIPKGSYVLDLEGRTMYYPYPYYVCCLSFGQFGPSMTYRLPSLIQALKQTKTAYIYQAEINRVGALSQEDRQYIESNYTPAYNRELFLLKSF